MSVEVSTLDFVLDYIRRGWFVFPLQPRSKLPVNMHGDDSHGYLDAVNDELNAAAIWTKYPSAGIGLALVTSGLVALDIDPRNGGDPGELSRAGEIPPTLQAVTGRGDGGRHILFTDPAVELNGSLEGIVGVDVKRKGYIAVEPSLHSTGGMYAWATDDDVAPMPDWILERCIKRVFVGDATVEPLDRQLDPREQAYVDAAIEAECANMAAAPEGERNNTLARSAFVLGRLVGGRVLDRGVAERRLREAAQACGLYEAEERATETTLRKQLDIGIGMPRVPPPPDDYHEARARLRDIVASPTPYVTTDLFIESNPEQMRLCKAPELDVEYQAAMARIVAVDKRERMLDITERLKAMR